jgi:electron transport complex protein RnfD
MPFGAVTSPHVFAGSSVPVLMQRVLYALLPGIAVMIYLFGWGVLINILLASVVALVCEAFMLAARGKPVALYLSDGSALVTAWLLAIALPALAPWWVTAVGTGFAVIVAKHLYGGLGYNPFNPAMVGYVVLLISFPRELTSWPAMANPLSFADTAQLIFTGALPSGLTLDAILGATPLDTVKTQLGRGLSIDELWNGELYRRLAEQPWEWPVLAFLAGGSWLVWTRTAAWQIPAAMLGALTLIAGIFHVAVPQHYPTPGFHVFQFSAVYGAFFIATDPVSASTTPLGRWIYGAGIGILVYLIRTFGGYPDGVAFAVLLLNIAVPTIDYYTQPRIYGARRV